LSAVTARVDGLRQVFATEVDGLISATDAAVERTRTLAANLAEDRAAIDSASERLAVAGDHVREQFAALAAELPGAEAHVDRIAEVLRISGADARRQIQETEDLLAAVWSRSEEAGAQARTAADALTGVIAAIAASATDAESRLGAYATALETSADAALAKTGEALEATRLGVEAQTSALAAAIARTSLDLDDIGGRAVETIAARIDSIAGHVAALGAELQRQDGRSQSLLDTIERGFSVLDAKLANAAQSSDSILASLSARMLQVRGEIDALSAPLDGTRAVARDLGDAIAGVRDATQAALAELADGVPAGAERGIGAIDALRGSVANLSQDVDRLNARAAALGEPINSGRRAIDELLDGLEDQRESLEVAVAKVRSELETAQAMIAGIERSTESTALGATTQLIEALGRVREVAAQTAGTVKAALDNVVAEARESLAKASREAVRESMHAPVEAQIRALEAASERGAEAAQAAAERLSRQLVSVAETAAAIEARVTAADAHLDEAQRTDLGRQSELLIEALNSASIDIAKGLSAEVTETAWKAYMAGDRGVFGRKAVQLLSRGDNREVARRYSEDGEFRDAVRRYIHDFEAMMRRVGADREAGALSMTLLSSDIGKLYVALAQATNRLR
jgi:predicted  nucleic acid-binding Zn-ribbon protein